MPLIQTVVSAISYSPATAVSALCCTLLLPPIIYRLFFHPISYIPGPLAARITPLFLYVICYAGIECRVIAYYHRKYNTTVLRIAPNSVSISDGAALHTIYSAGGGFRKDSRYQNFKIEGHDTIFSTLDLSYRDSRAKAVAPLFAQGRVRAAGEKEGALRKCVDKFLDRFEKEKQTALTRSPDQARVDILDLASRLSIDVLTGYLFNREYGGLDEDAAALKKAANSQIPNVAETFNPNKRLSATPFLLAIVAFSRFSLLPNRLFAFLLAAFSRLFPDPEVNDSLNMIEQFATGLFDDGNAEKGDTYQSRLLGAGISEEETLVQCKAVMFAGADSTGVKLASILFHLVQHPDVSSRLREEFEAKGGDPTATDPQTLPYLRAVIKEGLRLGMANPARLTRVVPPSGLDAGGFHIPAGTVVGAAAYVLHHNPEIFPDPFAFRPERWLEESRETGDVDAHAERQKRERDMFPFGLGSRMCIGRNLATHQLFVAVRAVIESGLLEGARTCKDNIEIFEWFNAEIKGHQLDIEWVR